MQPVVQMHGVQEMQKVLQSIPARMRRNVLVPAMTRAGQTLAARIRKLVPVQQGKKRKRNRANLHYRDTVTQKIVDFAKSGNVVALAGAASTTAPHATLVEGGTVQRFTNSKTIYRRVAVGVRKVLKGGKLVTKADKKRVSVGSKLRDKKKPQLNRGAMPAFKPIAAGSAQSQSDIAAQLARDIRAGIAQEFAVAKMLRTK